MKNRIALLYSALIILNSLSCSKTKVEQFIPEIKIDYTNQVDVRFPLTSEWFNNRKLVVLETTSESLITQINRLIIFENKYFIFDYNSKSVFVFNELGQFITKIKRVGQGAGEYAQVTDFTIDTKNRQIILLCDIPNCLMYFDLDGRFLKKEKKENYDNYVSATHNALIFSNILRDSEYYIEIRNDGKHTEFLPIEKYIIDKAFFSPHPNIIRSSSVYFFKVYDNIVYKIEPDKVTPQYKIDFGSKSVDRNFIEKNDVDKIIITSCENEWICRLNDFRECDNYITFGLYPFNKIIIYDKQKKTSTMFSQFYDHEMGLYLSNMIGYDGDGSDMIFIVNPALFKNNILNIKDIEVAEKNETYLKYQKIAENLNEVDNPILMVYSLK